VCVNVNQLAVGDFGINRHGPIFGVAVSMMTPWEKIGSKSSGWVCSGTDTRTKTDSGGTEIRRRKR